jgi:ABC-type nitrate/sulfonate/bicarbonate transport system substrate-binding protein
MNGIRVAAACALLAVSGLACQPASAPPAAPASKPAPTAAVAPASTTAPAAQAPPTAAPDRVKVEYMAIIPIVNYWHHYVAQAVGFYDAQGIDFEMSYAENTSRVTQALASGSVDLGGPSPDSVINAVEQGGGGNLVILGGDINKIVYTLVAAKDVHGYADLRGKTLAVPGLQEGSAVVLKKMLAANRLGPDDYSFIPVGGTANRASAVVNGTAAGALIGQPQDFRLVAEGQPSLGLSADAVPYYQFDVIAGRRDWAQRNADTVVRFLRAIVQADRWLYDAANRERAAQIAVDILKMTPDEGLRSYDLLVTQTQAIPHQGEVSTPGMQTVIEIMAEIGLLTPPLPPPDKYVDGSYLARAQQ